MGRLNEWMNDWRKLVTRAAVEQVESEASSLKALDGKSVSHGGSWVWLYKGLQQTKLMYEDIPLFVDSFIQYSSGFSAKLSCSVVFGRILFVLIRPFDSAVFGQRWRIILAGYSVLWFSAAYSSSQFAKRRVC